MITVASPTQVSGGPKARLSLDLSSLPTSYNAISSPTSPALSLEPSSPTLSGSFCVNKSSAELTALLKDAYNMIKEKERDLMLAAEIGKSLLENNNELKERYELLVGEYRKMQRRQTSAQSHAVQGRDRDDVTRVSPPSGSMLDPFVEEPGDYYDSDSDSTTGVSSGLSIADAYLVRRSRSPRRHNNVNFKEMEQIRELESINQDLQAKLDIKISEMNANEKASRARDRKLEIEMERLQQAAGLADQKIEELERENNRLTQKQKTDFWNLRRNKRAENEDVVEELLRKVHELEEQNTVVERAKADIEKRLQRTLKELSILQEKSAVLEDTQKECADLHDVLRNQSEQIQELNMSLEEQRQINLGMRSGFHSRSNSISDGSLVRRRVSNPDTVRALLLGGTPASPGGQKFSLLEEMETAWYRDLAMFKRERKKVANDDDVSSVSSELDLQEFLKRNGVHPDDDEVPCIDYLSDEEFTFLEEFEEDETTALRRREWFWKRWYRAVLRFFLAIWRWCRFLVLISVAVIMALYRGPDAVLPPIEMM